MAVIEQKLSERSYRWLVTGCAGFIGSNLVEYLLSKGQTVVGLDNFSTGKRANIEDVLATVGEKNRAFQLVEGDVRDLDDCRRAVSGVDFVLHQAALGSVPMSIEDPLRWNEINVSGTLNMMVAARDAKVAGFVYASSSSVYGDSEKLPKEEDVLGTPLSPYAVSKLTNELYAEVFARCYGFSSIGLRYFNVFGKRQDPDGAYAAVIPRWVSQMARGEASQINGDGETSRDYCYIANVVQANILSSFACGKSGKHQVFNVGVGERTTLKELHQELADAVAKLTNKPVAGPQFAPFRPGDVRHSLAATSRIEKALGFKATHTLRQGIAECVPWYLEKERAASLRAG